MIKIQRAGAVKPIQRQPVKTREPGIFRGIQIRELGLLQREPEPRAGEKWYRLPNTDLDALILINFYSKAVTMGHFFHKKCKKLFKIVNYSTSVEIAYFQQYFAFFTLLTLFFFKITKVKLLKVLLSWINQNNSHCSTLIDRKHIVTHR